MQRRMVAVLAARQLSLGEGSVDAAPGGGIESDFAAPAGNVVGVHLEVFAGHVRWAERLPAEAWTRPEGPPPLA